MFEVTLIYILTTYLLFIVLVYKTAAPKVTFKINDCRWQGKKLDFCNHWWNWFIYIRV